MHESEEPTLRVMCHYFLHGEWRESKLKWAGNSVADLLKEYPLRDPDRKCDLLLKFEVLGARYDYTFEVLLEGDWVVLDHDLRALPPVQIDIRPVEEISELEEALAA